MRFLTLALMLAAVAVTTTNADVVIEDETQAEERTTQKPKSKKQAPRKAAKLSPEVLQKKKDDKKRRSKKLESCLILTRAYYSQNQQMFKNYVDGHLSTRVINESDQKVKKQAQQNEKSLMAVINADQLIQCEESVTDEQINHIQKQKAAKITDDLKLSGRLKRLVKVSFVKYDDHGVSGGMPTGIGLQPQQNAILNMIQEISDTLAKTNPQKAARSTLGLGYLDMSNSIAAQLLYLVGLVAFIGVAIRYFYDKTVVKQEAENALIQARIKEKAEKKAKKAKKA